MGLPVADRLELYSEDAPNGCRTWTRATTWNGYGKLWANGRLQPAHRLAYELANGPIPPGLVLDHLCRNPACINPMHLEPVTNRENLMRGDTIVAKKAAQTHCVNGHAFTPENTYIAPYNGTRRCRACRAVTTQTRKR